MNQIVRMIEQLYVYFFSKMLPNRRMNDRKAIYFFTLFLGAKILICMTDTTSISSLCFDLQEEILLYDQ